MTSGRIWGDFETKSEFDITGGVWEYSLHPTTDVIVLCYRIRHPGQDVSTEPVKHWIFNKHGSTMPGDLRAAIEKGYEFEAHNYSFEWAIWLNIMVKRYGWCPIPDTSWRDTMAVACYYGLPAKLDALLRALKMPGKHPEGSRLITRYSKLYLKTAKREIPPEDMAKWIEYCTDDVLKEERVSDYLGDLPDRELPIFQLDGVINRRGISLDLPGIATATTVVTQRAAELVDKFRTITGGGHAEFGLNPTQTEKVKEWARAHGVVLENMQAAYLEKLLDDVAFEDAAGNVDDQGGMEAGPVREALLVRLKINKASTKKLAKMALEASSTGRALWQQRYHGAATGRQTGAGFQPLNLVKSWEPEKTSDGYLWPQPDDVVRDIGYGNPAYLDAVYGDAMDTVSHASRHWITAAPGHVIMAGDFVSIEAVILACLAGEEWRIQAFRDKKRLYSLMGDKIHNLPEGTTKKGSDADADGKKGELAFGYQGALNAWLKFDDSGRHSDERIIEICKAWRAACPNIVAFWRGLEDAAVDAVRSNVRATTSYRDIGFQLVDEWLTMILPDGKRLWYREPELQVKMPTWHKPDEKEDCRDGSCKCRAKAAVTYMAQKEGQFRRVSTYGGKLAENACQAVSRQFLMPSMFAAEKHGYPVVLSVYDEIVTEPRIGHGSEAEFKEILLSAPGRDWAAGWPIGVGVWSGSRYRKD